MVSFSGTSRVYVLMVLFLGVTNELVYVHHCLVSGTVETEGDDEDGDYIPTMDEEVWKKVCTES